MKTVGLVFFIQAIFLTACVGDSNSPVGESYVNVGDMVPDFAVAAANDLNGGEGFESPGFFIENQSLLVFFVTWCPDCWRELPFVQYANEKIPQLNVAAINWGEPKGTVVDYLAENEFTMPAYLDPGGSIFKLFASKTIPRIYLIDEEGKVVWMAIENLHYGNFTEAKGDQFNELIKSKLNLQ